MAAALSYCDSGQKESDRKPDYKRADRSYSRIISLAPSITETLFALGLGNKVVGVTRFCAYPPEASDKQSVGGYLNPNYEMMATLTPDLVLLLPEHETIRIYLDQLDIHYVTIHNRTVDEILETIDTIGILCGVETKAGSLIADIKERINTILKRTGKSPKPSVLISIGRTMGTGTIKDVYVAGAGTFYDELIDLAGGKNAYNSDDIAYPLLSAFLDKAEKR